MTTPSVPAIPELAERLREQRTADDEAFARYMNDIKALQAENAQLRAALRPFAQALERYRFGPDELLDITRANGERLNVLLAENFTAARSALEELSRLKAGEGEGFAAELRQQATDWHDAVYGEGPRAFCWTDKPHRELIEATKELRRAADEIDRLRALPPAPGGRSDD